MSKEQQADELVKKAEKKLNSWGLFGNKWEDALDYYTKAANLYKTVKKWDEAGATFLKIAQCHTKLDSKHEAASAYAEAANCYRKTNTSDAILALQQAIEIFTEMGRFTTAAKEEKNIAEIYENEGEIEKAMEHYGKAADYFSGENSNSSANACWLKIAHFAGQLGKYQEAINLFEKVANASIDNNLLKFSVKDYLFKAMLCHLAAITDNAETIDDAKTSFERYKELDLNFPDSRECSLIAEVIKAYDERDVEAFTDALRDYDRISKLDNWKTTLLLRVKNHLSNDHGGLEDTMGDLH